MKNRIADPSPLTVSTPGVPAEVIEVAKKRGILSFVGIGLSIGFLLLVIAAGAVLIVIPKMAGAIPLTILTQSMEPLLPPGTLVVDQHVKASDVHLGDVVTYQIAPGQPDVITHRVVGISLNNKGERTFTFKGDNNANPDADPVLAGQIKGRVMYSIPYIGVVSLWMNGPARAFIVPIAAGALFLFSVWMFVGGAVDKWRKRKRAQNHTLAA
jgi:signal peptidase